MSKLCKLKNFAAALCCTTMLAGSALNVAAADYTEDGSATIPINAEVTVQGSYTLTLPATITDIDSGAADYAVLNFPIIITWDNLPNKVLSVLASGTFSEYPSSIENPSISGMEGYCVSAGTEFNSSEVYIGESEGYTMVWAENDNSLCLGQTGNTGIMPTSDTVFGSNTATAYTLQGNILTDSVMKYSDLPIGIYVGSVDVSWQLYDVNPAILQ